MSYLVCSSRPQMSQKIANERKTKYKVLAFIQATLVVYVLDAAVNSKPRLLRVINAAVSFQVSMQQSAGIKIQAAVVSKKSQQCVPLVQEQEEVGFRKWVRPNLVERECEGEKKVSISTPPHTFGSLEIENQKSFSSRTAKHKSCISFKKKWGKFRPFQLRCSKNWTL